jgi:predicted ribosome quality control (RQC) complex YloA/Tae2 family protein
MKNQLSSLEIRYLVEELKVLVGGRIDKVFQADKQEFYFQFHVSGRGKKILKITDKLMYLTDKKPETEAPPGFCMYLRKQLGNSRLKELKQKESERIVEFVFDTKDKERKLIVELFGGGNLLILGENDLILSAAHYEKFKDRDVLAKLPYEYPKMKYNLFDFTLKDLKEMFKSTNKDKLVKCLAVDLGLGGVYSEEVCLLSKIDKNQEPKKIKDNEISLISKSIKKITKSKINSQIIYEGKGAVDTTPFPLDYYKDLEAKKFDSFNEALEHYFTNEVSLVKKKESKYEKQIKELERIIKEQETTIKSLKNGVEENSKKAELVYSNYQLINGILEEINKAKVKYSWDVIKKKLKGHKVVKDLDIKEKRVVIEIK